MGETKRTWVALCSAMLCAIAFAPSAGATRASNSVETQPDQFYLPPPALIEGSPGTVVWHRPAQAYAHPPSAGRSRTVIYRSRSIKGAPIGVSGTVSIPRGTPPSGGWPIVSWAHVTTGAANSCAPSSAEPNNPEWERLTRGDRLVDLLLQAGIAVARTDYEGIGGVGPHPYLIGRSLARSQIEIVRAAREVEPAIGRRWAAAGHSEGGVSSIFSAQYAKQFAPELQLVGVSALTPPIATHLMLDIGRQVPIAVEGAGGLSALAALIVGGALASDPILEAGAMAGGLSDRAIELLDHVEQRCFEELSKSDSWGGLAPNRIVGPKFARVAKRFYSILDANDPVAARVGSVPIRLDLGLLDPLASDPAGRWFLFVQRLRGANILYRLHPTGTHMNITDPELAAPAVVEWLSKKFR